MVKNYLIAGRVKGERYRTDKAYVIEGDREVYKYEILSTFDTCTLLRNSLRVGHIRYEGFAKGPFFRGTWRLFLGEDEIGSIHKYRAPWKPFRFCINGSSRHVPLFNHIFMLAEFKAFQFNGYLIKSRTSRIHMEQVRDDMSEQERMEALIVGAFMWHVTTDLNPSS